MAESASADDPAQQIAALPWRIGADGELEILLVTSRISQHWLLPKGWPMAGKTNAQAAAQEAFEEAGIKGKTAKSQIGKFGYDKIGKDGSATPCMVSVYPMTAVRELDDWPEQEQRQRQWFTLDAAAAVVFEPGLAAILSLLMLRKGEIALRRVWRPKAGKTAPPARRG